MAGSVGDKTCSVPAVTCVDSPSAGGDVMRLGGFCEAMERDELWQEIAQACSPITAWTGLISLTGRCR
jgi:hypothetical protein